MLMGQNSESLFTIFVIIVYARSASSNFIKFENIKIFLARQTIFPNIVDIVFLISAVDFCKVFFILINFCIS